MGYRSNVSIVLKMDDFEKLASLSAQSEFDYIASADTVETFVRHNGQAWVHLGWVDVKWYSAFPEVQLILDFLADVPHEFLRSGDELEDVEHSNTTDECDVLYVKKTIGFFP